MASSEPEPCSHAWEVATRDGGTVTILCSRCDMGRVIVEQPEGTETAILKEARRERIKAEARLRLKTEANPAPVFSCVSSVADCALAPDKLAFLVGEICPMGSIVLFTSSAKAGKTTLLQALGLGLAKGERQFLGFDLVRDYERSICYVNLDESAETFRFDVGRLGPHERFLTVHLPGGSVDLSLPSHVAALTGMCIANGVGVLMLDVFTSAFPGDENVNAEVIAAWNGLQALKAGAALDVIFVAHHSGKGAAQKGKPRGASAFAGKADVLWQYVDRGERSYFSTSKARGTKSIGEFLVRYDEATHRISRGESRSEERASASADTEAGYSERMVAYVAMNPGASGAEIQAAVGGTRAVVKRIRDDLVAAGGLVETRRGNGKTYRIGSA